MILEYDGGHDTVVERDGAVAELLPPVPTELSRRTWAARSLVSGSGGALWAFVRQNSGQQPQIDGVWPSRPGVSVEPPYAGQALARFFF